MLSIRGVRKSFDGQPVLRGIDLEVAAGEVVALLGPSGSGKTTLLRTLMGFESLDAGEIHLRDERIDGQPAHRRDIGFVFQNYALFPHLSVADNIAFGPRSRAWPKSRQRERVQELLHFVDLAGFEDRRIGEISGGQQQRVALARALASEPDLVLLDEPLSNLDPDLRERTRRELRTRMKAIGVTVLIVTHEQDEAFELGDRVAVLSQGRLVQVGTPSELYDQPADRFVASFVGRASWLAVRGEWIQSVRDREVTLTLGGGEAEAWNVAGHPDVGEQLREGRDGCSLWLRPEHLELVDANSSAGLPGVVEAIRFLGPYSLVSVALDDLGTVEVQAAERVSMNTRVGVRLRPQSRSLPRLFPAVTSSSELG